MSARDRARRRYGRIAARTVIGLAALVTLAVVLGSVDRAAGDIRTAREAAVDALPALLEVQTEQSTSQIEFERVLEQADVGTRIPMLEQLVSRREAAATAWARARPLVAAVPAARPAADRYDTTMARLADLADFTSVLATAPDPRVLFGDPRVVQLRELADAQRRAIDEILDAVLAAQVVAPADGALDALGVASRASDVWLVVAAAGIAAVALHATRIVHREARDAVETEARRDAEARRLNFEQDVASALAMAPTEAGSLDVAGRALRAMGLPGPAELLLADSSQAHLDPVLVVSPAGEGPQCPVGTPGDCPAVARGHAVTFPSSELLAACPHLRNRPGGPCSALCIPVTIASRTVGVLHAVAPPGEPPDGEPAALLGSLAGRIGDQLSRVRATAETEAQASTDALTGLLNRRTFENEFRRVAARRQPFALAFGDVDHFKVLNDQHGHDTGDRALRILARTMRRSVRDGDLVARWGGEEFLILFPGLGAGAAVDVLERLRTNLAIEQAGGAVPPFTVSFGVCDDSYGTELDGLLARADAALLGAKQAGRDRVVVAEGTPGPPVEARAVRQVGSGITSTR